MANWFITGVSRGLGHALARAVLDTGDTVVGTVRGTRPDLKTGPDRLHILTVDLADRVAAAAAVDQAFEKAGRIDVIVNNAGFGLLGAIEMASDKEVQQLFEVNVFSPFSIIRAALPHLRRQGSGHIVNITSIAGRAPGVASGLYAATKYALEGLSVSLAQEVAPLGIKVTAVAPGAFRTEFLSPGTIRKSEAADASYSKSVGQSSAALASMAGHQLGDPDRAARAILAAVRSDNPPLHLLLGSDALRRARVKLNTMAEEMDQWEELTLSTDFPEAD